MRDNDPVAAAAAAAVHGGLLSHSELLIWHREIGEMAAAAFR